MPMTAFTNSSELTEHDTRWKWFLALGALLVVLGVLGLSVATVSEVTSLLVFGPLLLVSSLLQFLHALFADKPFGKEALLHFASAGLEAVLGFFIMAHHFQGSVSLIAWIAIILIASGLVRLTRSLTTQPRGRSWTIIAGVVALLLGICVWTEWPVPELWFVGLCIAVDFICHGVSWSALALAERRHLREPVS
jgi:uncharacterized membrane protein HdeD (DUF308 family)